MKNPRNKPDDKSSCHFVLSANAPHYRRYRTDPDSKPETSEIEQKENKSENRIKIFEKFTLTITFSELNATTVYRSLPCTTAFNAATK